MPASETFAEVRGHPPRGPSREPLFILRYLKNPLECYQSHTQKYGDPFMVPFQGKKFVVTGHPDGVRDIFSAPRESFGRPEMGLELMLGQYSLLLMAGEPHYQARKRLNPTFTPSQTQPHVPLMQQTVLDVFRKIPRDRETRALEWTRKISMRVILKAVFGIREEEALEEFERCFRRFHGSIGFCITFFPFMRRNLGPFSPWVRFLKAREELHQLIDRQVKKTRSNPEHTLRDGVLSQLIAYERDAPALAFSDEEIRDHLFTIVMAGHESTASGLAWAIYWFHRCPDVRAKLLAEIESEAPDLDPQRLVKLPYLEAFCKETLRIHPLIPDLGRRLVVPFVFNGCELEAGNMVIASINLVHHRSDLYPEPDTFRPERFLERTFSPYEFLPFGGGHRHCLGSSLGMHELKIVLATLFKRFEFEVNEPGPVRPSWSDTVRVPKGGIRMRVTRER